MRCFCGGHGLGVRENGKQRADGAKNHVADGWSGRLHRCSLYMNEYSFAHLSVLRGRPPARPTSRPPLRGYAPRPPMRPAGPIPAGPDATGWGGCPHSEVGFQDMMPIPPSGPTHITSSTSWVRATAANAPGWADPGGARRPGWKGLAPPPPAQVRVPGYNADSPVRPDPKHVQHFG